MLSNKRYDSLKFIAQVLLPVLGTLYFVLSGILDLPSTEQVIGAIIVIDMVLGAVLYISASKYQGTAGGDIVVKEVGDKKVFSLELNEDPEILETKDSVTFQVRHG